MTRDLHAAVSHLATALPPGRVSTAEADLLAVTHDAWPRHLVRLAHGAFAAPPAVVVWPESTEEVQRVLVTARDLGLSVVVLGGGSSVVGGASPSPGQVVLDLKRMQRVLEIDAQARTSTAQAGILGETFARILARRGFTQGHFPSSIYCSTLGGWIAARSAGQFSTRYGKIEDQVLGGVAVLGDGTRVSQRAAPARTVELDSLMGAEGSLAVWTEACVRIHPVPAAQAWRGFEVPGMERAVAALEGVLAVGLVPSVVRLYDPLDTLLHRRGARKSSKNSAARWAARFPRLARILSGLAPDRCRLVVGVEGDAQRVDLEMRHIVEVVGQHGGEDLGEAPGLAWYRRRYAISYEQSRAFRAGLAVDTMEVACTWERLMPVYAGVRRAGRAAGAIVAAHISHAYVEGAAIYFTFALPWSWGVAAYDDVWRAVLTAALASGANVSHHHGTGQLKAAALAQSLGGATAVLADLRQRLDPAGTLRPHAPAPPAADPEVRGSRSRAPLKSTLLTALPASTLAEIERDLGAQARSLGGAAHLFGAWSLLDAAKERLLWRLNPQLGIIESVVAGVDARVGGVPHHFVPAPRAATGPELLSELLRADVERVWLRTSAVALRAIAWRGETAWALALAEKLAREPALLGARVALSSEVGACQVSVDIAPGPLAAMIEAHLRSLVGRDPEVRRDAPALSEPGVRLAGPWASVRGMVREAHACGLRVVLPWVDPFGAVGFVYDPQGALDADRRRRLALLADELGAWPVLARQPAGPAKAGGGEPVRTRSAPAGTFTLSLAPHAEALDNCTYCPKLCRVSCPVAVAAGSETLTPRQLMLTANLSRTGRRALSADVAARLWACVDCRGCTSLCEHGNDVAHVLQAARAELWDEEHAPAFVREALAAVPRGDPRQPAEPRAGATWLFLGCQNLPEDHEALAAALALARRRDSEVRVAAGSTHCCGHPLWRWGDRAGFARQAQALARSFAGAALVVVDDPGCAYAMRSLYPEVGVTLPPVVTVATLVREQGWRLPAPASWAVHESCFAVRGLGELPLAPDLGGWTSMWGSAAGCCGGMLLPAYDAPLAAQVAQARVDDLMGSGAARIVTASPTCRRRLRAVCAEVDDLAALWHRSAHLA